MTSQEIYEEFTSGEWIHKALNHFDLERLETNEDVRALSSRLALHFQEMWKLYITTVEEEKTKELNDAQAVVVALNEDASRVDEFRAAGWKITARAKKVTDVSSFLEDYKSELPVECLAVIKSKLPPALKKEITKYESLEGQTYTVKR